MEKQLIVLEELLKHIDTSKAVPTGAISFKVLASVTGLSNEELDDTLNGMEKDGLIVQYVQSNHDEFGYQINAAD